MSLKINRKVARIAALPAAVALVFFTGSNIASANPDDSTEVEVEVPVTEVPTPDYDNSDEEVVTTDVETTEEETSDGDYETGETSYSTVVIEPEYDDPEGEWTDDTDSEETTTDCPETTTEEPEPEYPDEEEDNPCCPEEDDEGDEEEVDEDTGVIIDNNNENYNENYNENNQEQNVEVNVDSGGGGDIGGTEVNVPVDITIDGSTVTVTKITETNVLNETTVKTPGGSFIVIRPDGNGGYTVAPQTTEAKHPVPVESHTGRDPVTVANVSTNRPLELWGGGVAGLVFIGGMAYAVSTSYRKPVNNDAGRI